MKKIAVIVIVFGCFFVASVPTEALTLDSFSGGVTGIPGAGTVWGRFNPSSRRVTVEASGRTIVRATANARGCAHAVASRAISGNTSRWWWS